MGDGMDERADRHALCEVLQISSEICIHLVCLEGTPDNRNDRNREWNRPSQEFVGRASNVTVTPEA